MAAPSSEQRELQLVGNVDFKILGVANKEDKLQQLLQRYLAPLILKAASEHASVRAKVIQVLSHLKTFIQPPGVVLPVKALLQQYKSSESPLIKQLDLTFIQHSLDRLNVDERRELVPIALRDSCCDQGQPRAPTFFNIILRLLLDVEIPPRGSSAEESFKASIGLSEQADSTYLSELFALFLRLQAPQGELSLELSNPAFSQQDIDFFLADGPGTERVLQRIAEFKTKVVKLLASAAFTDNEKFMPAIYASCVPDPRVSSGADEIIKRSSVSLEDPDLVNRLFDAHSVLPAVYRIRILGLLSKSAISSTMSKRIMDMLELDFSSELSTSAFLIFPRSPFERAKLHTALFEYLSWVARIGPSQEGYTVASHLIESMRDFIENKGWPDPRNKSHDDVTLRSKAYETISLLAPSSDMQVKERLDLVAWLLRSLSEDPISETVVNIDAALSSLTASIPSSFDDKELTMQNLLLSYMSLAEGPPAVRSTRHAVVKLANHFLPFSNIYGRWINILAAAGRPNERHEVVEQGHRGLDPWTHCAHGEARPVLPDWMSMVMAFFDNIVGPDSSITSWSVPGFPSLPDMPSFQNFQGPRIQAYPLALRYCKQMLLLTALERFDIRQNWMQTLDEQLQGDVETREEIRAYLHSIDSALVVIYLRYCLNGALVEDSPIAEECLRCFVDIASLSSRGVIKHLARFNNNLLPLIRSNNTKIRKLAARTFGILAAHPATHVEGIRDWCDTLDDIFGDATAAGAELNAAEGALLSFGHLASRAAFYGRQDMDDFKFPMHLIVEDNVQPSLFEAALDSLSELWLAKLSIPPSDGEAPLGTVVKKISEQAKKGNEKAITALGRLAVGLTPGETSNADDVSREFLAKILEELFALHEIKRIEVQFTVGEAITAAIAGWDSNYVRLVMDVESRNAEFQSGAQDSLMTSVLEKLFTDCEGTKPSLLKASGVWLFCIVQYCSHLEQVQSRLRRAQVAFMRLLSARDELVQETASRGLSLIYERGDSGLKSTLVKDLVSAFTGSGTQLKVDDDTELFEPGALPTERGNSITSYRDIVNLANEVGDQRLVYKFMSLAANAATWSTRSAFGRFGLSSILSDSEVDPKLYPKLYRYRFDPNNNVRRSMDDIWKALVKDSSAILDTHFDAIMQDLLKSILGREWRMREASCAAISDLISGRPFPQYEKYYRDIWTTALKVLDDVKGSVREAALRLCLALSNTLVRQLEEGSHGSAAKAMMQEALPFLLSDKGAESSVQEVQLFATITVLKIAKYGGKNLKPFIPDMVPQLLGLLSTIEPQQINYHYQRVGEESRGQIDKMRSQMVNQSPISEAIESSLRFVDEGVMAELAPRLEATIKSAIGMPTKIGCSRVLVTLFSRHSNDIKSFSGRFVHLIGKQILDKNDEVSQAYARAAAYIMRVVPSDAQLQFCERLVNLYLQAEEEHRRQKVADVVLAVAKVSPDHFTSQETTLLPFAYLGSNDVDEYTSKMFGEAWKQHSGSSHTVLRYVPEIVALVKRCLDTTQWSLRHTGAFTVAAMVTDVASSSEVTGVIGESNLKTIWPVFEAALALKTFPGKERLLEAYPDFVKKGGSLWRSNPQIAAQMKKIALREAKRNNDEYRVHAFRCLWRFARARDDDMAGEIATIVAPYLEELRDGGNGGDGGERGERGERGGRERENLAAKAARNGLEAIARGYSRPQRRQGHALASRIVKALEPYLPSSKYDAIRREVWYGCVYDLMEDLLSEPQAEPPTTPAADSRGLLLQAFLGSLDLDQAEVGTEPQRLRRAEAVSVTLRAHANGVLGGSTAAVAETLAGAVARAMEEERAPEVRRAWKDALKDLDEGRRRGKFAT